jgi:hypothetical protein
MPSEIMRSQFDPGQFPGIFDDDPCSSIGDREDPVLRPDRLLFQVRFQPIHHFSRNENYLGVLAALRALDGKLLVVYISGSELQDFADSHATSCHQFQEKPVSHLRGSEDDFVDCLLLDNVPVDRFAGPIELPQHWGIARVLNGRIEIGLDEIEERFEVGITSVFSLLFPSLLDFAQERQNFIGCDAGKILIVAELSRKFGERLAVGLNRIFFPNSFCGTLDRPELPVRVSWLASCLRCGWVPTDGTTSGMKDILFKCATIHVKSGV